MRKALIAPLMLAAALTGCPGTLEDPERFAGQFGTCPDIPTLFTGTCATASCHTADNPAGSLDLASPDIVGRLSGKAAAGGSGKLIDTGAPDQSVLYTKLSAPPPFGARMPLTGTPLDDTEVACVLTWIEDSTKGGSP
ncbi:MAG: hypothetical protein QM820_32875 [Minicystis sp.]